MEEERLRIWCHTCRRVLLARIDDSFDYKCTCGSEFIEEITDNNDPRLFAPQTQPQSAPQAPPRPSFPITRLVAVAHADRDR